MKKLLFLLMLASFSAIHTVSAEKIAVIVNKANSAELSEGIILNIFLSRSEDFGNGSVAIPLNQITNTTSGDFNRKVLKKSPIQLRAYWSKMLFTGRASKPREVKTDQDMIELIANNPNFIGYISAHSVTDMVKVVATY